MFDNILLKIFKRKISPMYDSYICPAAGSKVSKLKSYIATADKKKG